MYTDDTILVLSRVEVMMSTRCPMVACQDNDYSLVDSLIFIDSQDYRYRTINRCINCYHMDESHMDVVANIALFVESEKRVISGHSSCVTIIENYFSFP